MDANKTNIFLLLINTPKTAMLNRQNDRIE
ncbi:hypothetical protein CAXC1_320004 [Candidatus Xenohaliotis californiensis]|uniref:Uncharacterized protein n=1 Tax=Candidatus Xenohaliotis californiensis TaxID=84677 RepID=A0ABM9N899_9RICK|nr:hypothetical protein CAXC1_320004 [Candidatus Xenohaliotis californiensis]